MLTGDPVAAAALPPFDPRDEVRPGLRRGPRGRYLKAAEVDARLGEYDLDVRAGVPDALVARRAGLSVEQVRQWRRRHHIAGGRSRSGSPVGSRFLVGSLLGQRTAPAAHVVSPVAGEWSPPAYVLREPLRYDLFAEMVHALADRFTLSEIARGIGIAERDVMHALTLLDARGAR